jgi:hypothetical protein
VGAARDGARRGGRRGSARCGMAAPPRGGLRRADDAVSHVEQSEELGISVGCRIINGVDRGESVDGPVGSVTVMERARSRASDFYRTLNVCFVALPIFKTVELKIGKVLVSSRTRKKLLLLYSIL